MSVIQRKARARQQLFWHSLSSQPIREQSEKTNDDEKQITGKRSPKKCVGDVDNWCGVCGRFGVWFLFLRRLEAFAMDDRWAGFVVFLFADPHLLEGGQ
jgi:hypothetical protein